MSPSVQSRRQVFSLDASCGWAYARSTPAGDSAQVISGEPFLGAEAIAAGVLNRHQLRTRYRIIFPGVYLEHSVEATMQTKAVAAWLWSRRRAVVGGQAAAALRGAKWVNSIDDVELFWSNTRPPAGVKTRNELLVDHEFGLVRGIPVTTAARTAFDLARLGPVDPAVARVDALIQATGVKPADVELVASNHRGARRLRQLETVLALSDSGAESPRETWLRLLLGRGGLPPLRTQFEVLDDGRFVARLDMAWPDLLVAVEYDGEQHRTDRRQYIRDLRRLESLERLGWIVVRVVAGDSRADIIRRVRSALALQASRLNPGRRD
jgi:very-short-patch-repair endonuclease